ncbi:MAG TPA: hypothetical protein VKT78_17820 [Fimbriimonadaceae bacterium]|nr:hypothetical protein [Fimbriimonadaceae bacterium]
MAQIPTPEPMVYTSKPLHLPTDPVELEYTRADLEFHGLDHSEWSFEGELFINNPKADAKTAKSLDNGYVGSFHVFGHGGCYGNEGHCEIPAQRRAFDRRRPHHLTPIVKTVIVTNGLKKLLPKGGDFTVTVVGIVRGGTEDCDPKSRFLQFEKIRLVTHR